MEGLPQRYPVAGRRAVKKDGGVYAAIDFGSNSINLVVYRMTGDSMSLLSGYKAMLGIIGYIRDGKLNEEGLRKAVEVIAEMRRRAQEMGAEVFCFATASLRGIINQREALEMIHTGAGVEADLVSWEREAYYDYLSVVRLMNMKNTLAVDIGGGSIELIWIRGGSLHQSASIPTGSLKLCRDYVRGVRPEVTDMEHIEAAVNRYLDEIGWVGETGCEALCTVGGTARAVAKLHREIFSRAKEGEDYAYPAEDMDALFSVLADKDRHYDIIMKLFPDRIHTITPGFLALRAIARRAGVSRIDLSRYGVREGYLIEKVWMQEAQ